MIKKQGIKQSFSLGPYNKYDDKEQWMRISQGCPNQCPYCYEPKEEIVFDIPEIVRNKVKIMDMNLLSKPQALEIINILGERRVNDKVINYELICGIDWRFLTQELADSLKKNRFKNIRFAWDFGFEHQYKMKDTIDKLKKAGYKCKDVTIFMICNWHISFDMCFRKLYLCAVWNIKVSDCYFDGQVSPNIKPIGWSLKEIQCFRKLVRKHNQLVTFKIDPEKKIDKKQRLLF